MRGKAQVGTTLQVGTKDGIFSLAISEGDRCELLSAGLRSLAGDYVAALESRSTQPLTIYCAGCQNGKALIAISEDASVHWKGSRSSLPAPTFDSGALALRPGDPATLFYGSFALKDRERGATFVSHDNGQSWTVMQTRVPLPPITRLAICC